MLPLVFLLLAGTGPAPIVAAPVQARDLARMTWRQAQQLDGQAIRVSFVVDSLHDVIDSEILVGAESAVAIYI
jgi:hypothetical protein